jgi:hypothetical protein
VLSPAVLPAVNLMLDVPALALSLLAMAAMLAAAERNSFDLAAVAGLLTGLAMQTKYTGFTTPVVLALAAGRARWRITVVAWLVAFGVFVAWESFLVQRYGESHFVYHLTHATETARRANLIGPLFTLVGGVGGALVPLGLAALGASARATVASAVLVAGSYLVIAFAPPDGAPAWLSWETLVFGVTGATAIGLLAAAAAFVARREGAFLAAWLALEIVGYLALSPWPAARRVMAFNVVGALLFARLAAQKCPDPRLVVAAPTLSVVLGLLFQAADIDAAWAMRVAIRAADQSIRGVEDRFQVRFVGRHGMQFESERLGLKKYNCPPLKGHAANGLGPFGGYLIADQEKGALPKHMLPAERLLMIEVREHIPWRTQPGYSGMKVPIRGRGVETPKLAVFRQRYPD